MIFEIIKEYVTSDPKSAAIFLYVLLYVLLAIVYQLGFARRLPLLKSLIIYFFIGAGSFILLFLALRLPIVEGLILAVLLLVFVRYRQRNAKPLR
jgi:hypothetical protein